MRVEAPVKVTWRDTNIKGKGLDDVKLSGITSGLDSVREDNIRGFQRGDLVMYEYWATQHQAF